MPTDRLERQFFLDWVRIIAFFLLILYHVGMYYVTWGWHVKSPHASASIEPFMMLSSPWRLNLLFMVSGVASGVMLLKGAGQGFAGKRSLRLLLPLVFGMLVIVPPQSYFQVLEQLAYTGSYFDFMKLYLSGYHGFVLPEEHKVLELPTWNHLWFVAYLWVYSMILWGLFKLRSTGFTRSADTLVSQLHGWRLMLLPGLLFALYRIALFTQFPQTNNLSWDWYNHAAYLTIFLFGAMLAARPAFWDTVARVRWHALGAAFMGWIAIVWYMHYFNDANVPSMSQRYLARTAWTLLGWNAILAATGFARLHLQHDGPARRYLTEAVFPVYILHQTLIVCFAHALKPAGIAPALEGLMLVLLTLVCSFAGFEFVRRIAVLRPLFGLQAASPVMRMPPATVPA